VTKPFSTAELLSRALMLRRASRPRDRGATVRKLGGLQIDLGRHEVLVDGERVHLTLSEFKVLSLLAEQPESVVSRRELMQHLWASEHVGDEHACEVHISNLRRKIERDPSHPTRIVTVREFGYKLMPVYGPVSVPGTRTCPEEPVPHETYDWTTSPITRRKHARQGECSWRGLTNEWLGRPACSRSRR
jgi:two-component system response regulator RegX3